MSNESIPRILHFIWLGNETYPENIINTWRSKNPGWTIKVWKDDDVSQLNMMNQRIFDLSKNSYQKSDVLRLEILYTHGGVYCDTDVICMKSIDTLVSGTTPIIVQEKRGVISNSFMVSPKFNPVILDMMKCMDNLFDPNGKVWETTGSKFVTKYLLDNDHVIQFESDRKYDYKSTSCFTVLPYYHMNMNYDNPRLFMEGNVDQTVLDSIKNNKDEKYVKYNNFDDESVYAFQLWGGGKQTFYNDILPNLNIDVFYKNMYVYISHISELRVSHVNREKRRKPISLPSPVRDMVT